VIGWIAGLMVLAAVGIAVLVAWMSGSNTLSTSARWWVLVGAMSPVSLLLLWFGLFPRQPRGSGDSEEQGQIGSTISLWGAVRSTITPIMLSASSLLLSPDIARPVSGAIVKLASGFSSVPLVGKVLAPFAKPIANVLGTTIFQMVGVGCATAIATLAVARVTQEVKAAATASDSRASGPSLPMIVFGGIGGIFRGIGRIASAPFRWVRSLLRRGAPQVVPDGEAAVAVGLPAGPELAALLQERLRSAVDPQVRAEWWPAAAAPPAGEAASDEHPHDEQNWLFGGRRPSGDQVAILDCFDERWREHAVAVERGEFGNDRQSHADVFVESVVDRATLSATLRACALFACVARGQRVLFLVADEEARQGQVDELRAALAQLQFESLYRIGTLDPAEVTQWCPLPTASGLDQQAEPPDIIVATPGDYDRALLSGTFDPVLVRSFLLSIEVLVIDGLQRLTRRDEWLLHLPFLVDKHRLLLRNENRAMQLLVGSAPVSDEWSEASAPASICRERLAIRLFGGDGRVKGHFMPLRPAFRPRPAAIRVHAERANMSAVLALAHRMLRQGSLPEAVAVLVAEHIEDERAEGDAPSGSSDSDRRDAGPRKISLRTIRKLGEEVLQGLEFLVVPPAVGVVERRTLHTLLGGRARPVLVEFSFHPAADAPVPADRPATALPVFVSAGAPAMFLVHLRSAAPAMRADAPTRREDFARFGLSWDEERWRSHAASMNPVRLHEGWHLETDGSIAAYAAVGDRQFAWPAVFVRRDDAVRWSEVRPEAPPDEGLCLLRDRERLELGSDPAHVDQRRFAVWMNSRGLRLGTTDLFRMSHLVLKTDRQEYRPMLVRSNGESTEIEAEPRALEGDDFVIPKTFTTITFPNDMGIDGPFAVRGARAFLFRVREQGTPLSTVETIVGLSSPSGQEIATEHVGYRVHASVTLVILGGEVPTDGSSVPDWIRAAYEGTWSTKRQERRGPRDTWPLLAHAVRVAIERCAPDLLRFARIFAFRPPFGHAGASLLVAETAATAGSALDAFRTLLDDADLRRSFVVALREAVMAAPETIPCVGPPETKEQAAQSRADALRVLDELESAGGWAPPVREGADELLGQVLVAEPGLPSHDGVRLPPGTVFAPEGESLRWADPLLCEAPGCAVEFGVILPFDGSRARSATASFGWRMTDAIEDAAALRARCVRLVGPRTIGPDYEAMIRGSMGDLRPVAEQLLAIADRAGLVTSRDRLRLFAGFVQTTRYVRQRAGEVEDGFERFGVQMPVETAFARAGDCDSSSLLLLALLRAGRVAPAGMMLVETEDAGHAMVAASVPPAAGDHVVRTATGVYVLVECTDLHPVGYCASEYRDRHVRIVAQG
jgi:hypothetical protein